MKSCFSWPIGLKFFTSLFLLALVQSQCGQAIAQGVEPLQLPAGVSHVQTVEGISEYRLANGLKVLLAPDVADDRVAVNLTYMVGSRHEAYGESGMAHLLEHLVFKGTAATPDPKTEFRSRGFVFNGTTTADRTDFSAAFVSNQESLDWYIGWQADAMVNSFISKKDLDNEMTVVRNEFEIGENNAGVALGQRMAHASYQWHAYGRATIGAKSDIENVDISKLRDFYKRFYRPDNAVLIVAGNFKVGDTLASIQRSLGLLVKPETALTKTYTLEPVQDGERSVVVRRPAVSQLLMTSYRTPPALHPDSVALSVLASALSDVPSGRLYKALVASKLAQATVGVSGAQREGGNIVFGVVFGAGDDAAPRQKLLLDLVENLAQEPIRMDEFERAKTRLEKSLEVAFSSATAVAQAAMQMEVAGDWRAVYVGRERLKLVNLDDVNRVARFYLLPDNRTLGHLIPTKTPQRASPIELPDVAAYLHGFTLKEKGSESMAFDYSLNSLNEKIASALTPGGTQTATLEKSVRGDLVNIRINFKFGNPDSLQGQGAVTAMIRQLVYRGTPNMSHQQIQDEFVRLGASVTHNFYISSASLSLVVKKDNLKAALDLALQLIKNSNFPENDFEVTRATLIKTTEGQINDTSARAENTWLRHGNPYPKGHVNYSHTLEEWLEEIKSVSREQVVAHYKRVFGAQNTVVTVLGPVDNREVGDQITEHLDGWRAPDVWQRVPYPLPEIAGTRLEFDTPDKTNVSLRATLGMALSSNGPGSDYAAMDLATRIFGGGPGSRLWRRLREDRGLSYSTAASFAGSALDLNSRVSMTTEVAPQNLSTAEAALKEEIARSLSQGFTEEEVERFKRQLLADRLRVRSGDAWAMNFMFNRIEYGYKANDIENRDALYASLDAGQVNAAWKKYLQPDKLVWGIFGDQSKIR